MQKLVRFIFAFLGRVAPQLGGKLAFRFFFTPFKAQIRSHEQEVKQQGEEHSFIINGKETFYTVWGRDEDPTIIFCHGWSSKGLHFHKFIQPQVQAGYQIVIPDFPAHANSEGKTSNVLEFKEVVLRLMEKHPTCYALVGHSLGAMAAILALEESSQKVEKLVVVNAAVWADTIMNRYMEGINGNNAIRKALLTELERVFGERFSEYSIAERILDIKQLPSVMVVVDDSDADAPLEEGKELCKRVNGKLLVTNNLGHNKGLRNDDVVSEITKFLA